MFNKLRLFLRQPFTQTNSKNDLTKIMTILDKYKKHPMDILPYKSVGEAKDFRQIFEEKTNIPFTPENFRNYRLYNIQKSNCMFIIRNSMSESTAFELGYIYSKFPDLPTFVAIDKECQIETTLIKDLHPNTIYYTYDNPDDIKPNLYNWLDSVAKHNNIEQTGGYHNYETHNSPIHTK